MTPTLELTVDGPPVGKARPRVPRRGRAYTPARTKAYELHVGLAARRAMSGRPMLCGPVGAHFRFTFPFPRSWSRARREGARWRPAVPDLDNLAKACADALNGIVYADDAQIVSLTCSKQYGPQAHTFLQLWEIRQ